MISCFNLKKLLVRSNVQQSVAEKQDFFKKEYLNNKNDFWSAHEQAQFDKGLLIVRGNVKEGHRTFSAFQPKAFMHQLLANVDILEHIQPESHNTSIPAQDIWIVRKR